ncbi:MULTISPECIES: trimeric intracellular cation channel family protein [Oceanicaulis]|uniref:trimeric intracellular cation channel family protein n=1 Tax=Oceanicaulis TaxID=153232 RepID=UPI0003B3FEE4|nr:MULTISPECIES: trimeric intracellular cation channel family protein [Oceanicaulis]MBL4537031.1 trimeric intracellular cation channel family protein [Oceanicaulis sp.]VXC53413.1 putative membrane protein YeiH [Oceanicaulis sp. 350]
MNVTLVFIILNYIGIFVFALSGGILSARKHLDPFGAAVIGAVTGMGGGTLRDVLLGRLPVYWIDAPHYLILALAGGVIGYYGSELVRGEEGARYRALIWADSLGLAVFCVLGAQAGLMAGAHWSIALVTGVMSAAFGGLVRDIIVNDVPLILRADVYALAALFGAAVYVAALEFGVPTGSAAVGAALAAFILRGCAIIFKWSIPPIGRVD